MVSIVLKESMQHYFIDKPHNAEDYFEFRDSVLGYELCFRSCDSIFSKDKIDDGTRALLNAIKKQINLEGYGLDLGCGLGVIGIALIKTFHVKMDMIDINKTAVRLTNENLIKNNVQHSAKAYFSDGFENVGEKYDFIISNPPIKSGKTMLFNLMKETYNHLKDNGQLILVIRKNHGMESLKKYLISIYSNCEIIARDKGYYILKSLKIN